MKKFEHKTKDERRHVLLSKNNELSYTFDNDKLPKGNVITTSLNATVYYRRITAIVLAVAFVLTTILVGVNLAAKGASGTYTLSNLSNGDYTTGYVNGEDNGLIVNKFISDNGNGTLNVTLEQYANENLKKTDIVLLLDLSGSMSATENFLNKKNMVKIDVDDIEGYEWYFQRDNYQTLGNYSGEFTPYFTYVLDESTHHIYYNDEVGYYYNYLGQQRIIGFDIGKYLRGELSLFGNEHEIYIQRVDAMKIVAAGFIDQIVESGYGESTNLSIIGFNNNTYRLYGNSLVTLTDENAKAIKYQLFNSLPSPSGGSYTNLAFDSAYDLLNNNDLADDNKAVILFTDGAPGNNSSFTTAYTFKTGIMAGTTVGKIDASNHRYCDYSIASAYNVKNNLSGNQADVYTVGFMDISDENKTDMTYEPNELLGIKFIWGTTTEDTLFNRYMQFMSSNYLSNDEMKDSTATGDPTGDYYKNSIHLNELSQEFKSIADKISSAGVEGSLDIKDIISDEFKLVDPDNLLSAANGLEVYTQKALADGTFDSTHNNLDPSELTFSNNTITYPDYDFASTYVSSGARTKGDDTNYYGEKLVISFNIKPDTFGGENLPTNGSESGIYSGNDAMANYKVPTVTVAVDSNNPLDDTYTNEMPGNPVQDKDIYLSQSVSIADLLNFDNASAQGDIDGVKNRHVVIVYSVSDSAGNLFGTYTVPAGAPVSNGTWAWENEDNGTETPTEDTSYSVSCTITNPTTQETVTSTESEEAWVYVYKPSITVADSTENAPTTVNLNNNVTAVVWKHGNTDADTGTMGAAPTLDYEFKAKDTEPTLDNDLYSLQNTTDFVVSNVSANDMSITSGTTFSNSLNDGRTNEFKISLPKYDVTITNNIDGNYGNTGESFSILVSWTEDGVPKQQTFTMTGDGAQQVIHADSNTTVVVNGHDINRDDYVTTYDKANVDTSGITITEATSVTITQTRDDILIEGIGDESGSTNAILYILAGIAVTSGGVGAAYLYHKKDDFGETE